MIGAFVAALSPRQAAFTVAAASPPWAPTPGISSGSVGASARTRASSSGKVAPTTRPSWPLVFHGPCASCARCSYSRGAPSTSASRWFCRSLPPGLEVRHSRIAPLPGQRR